MNEPLLQYRFEWGVNVVTVVGAGPKDVVFSHEDPSIQTVNITRLTDAINRGQVKTKHITAILTEINIKAMLGERDIDPDRVAQILADEVLYNTPVIFAGRIPDVILIDGTHRVSAHVAQKDYQIASHIVNLDDLRHFKVNFWVNGEKVTDTKESIMRTYDHRGKKP